MVLHAVRSREKLVRWSKDGEVNNTKTHYKFRFDGILPMKISQVLGMSII